MGKSNPIGAVDPALVKLGFHRIQPNRKKRITAEVSGRTKEGKSHLMMTMTEPIGILNTDRALEDLLPEFPNVDVIVKDLSHLFTPGEALTKTQGQKIEREYSEGYQALLGHRHIRSVGVTKWTTIWEVARYAEFGVASVKAHHYVPVNMRMRGYLGKATESDKNLLLEQDLKEEWINEKSTGRWIVDGFKYTPGLVQLNAVASRDEDGDFHLVVTGCGLNADLVGWDFVNDKIDWHSIAPMVMAETTAKDWK